MAGSSGSNPNLKDFLPLIKHAKQDMKNNAFQEAVIIVMCVVFYGALKMADPGDFSWKGIGDFTVICIFGAVMLGFFLYCSFIQVFKREIKR